MPSEDKIWSTKVFYKQSIYILFGCYKHPNSFWEEPTTIAFLAHIPDIIWENNKNSVTF